MRGFGVRNARHWSDKCDDACARGTGEQRDMYRNFEQRKFEQPRKHWSKVRQQVKFRYKGEQRVDERRQTRYKDHSEEDKERLKIIKGEREKSNTGEIYKI